MEHKTTTIDLKGKAYAQVKDRLQEFRSANPFGLIETTPLPQADGSMMFKARIVSDKRDPGSAEATGHAYSKTEKVNGEKGFEKLETIAVGRALALLGFGADGSIASSEEMEEFLASKAEKVRTQAEEVRVQIMSVKTLEELSALWAKLPFALKKELEGAKEEMKAILTTEGV